MGSVVEIEVDGLYMDVLEASPMRTTLQELGYQQPATLMQFDNSTIDGIINKIIKQKESKGRDNKFIQLQDRVKQGELRVFWASDK